MSRENVMTEKAEAEYEVARLKIMIFRSGGCSQRLAMRLDRSPNANTSGTCRHGLLYFATRVEPQTTHPYVQAIHSATDTLPRLP